MEIKTFYDDKQVPLTFINSVNYINCKIIEFLINKVLDVKPLVSFIIKDYAISLTNTSIVFSSSSVFN